MLRIELERRKGGWTQTELAYYAKMSMADISRIERGWLRPYNGMAKRLSDVLKLSVDDLTKEVKECVKTGE